MIDLQHLKNNKTRYWRHFFFSLSIASRMLLSAIFLFIHGIFPFIKPPKPLTIGRMSDFLFDKDYEIKIRILGI